MTYSSINEYLHDLRENLRDLPTDEKNSIIEEIETHLTDKMNELIQNGMDGKSALHKVLTDFKSPKELSQEYMDENFKDVTSSPMAAILLNLGLSGLVFLALPIIKGFSWAWISLGVPLYVIGLIIIMMKKHWSKIEVSYINSLPKIIIYLLFPASLLFFWIANNAQGEIVTFSLYYMIIYWLLLLVHYVFIKKVKNAV